VQRGTMGGEPGQEAKIAGRRERGEGPYRGKCAVHEGMLERGRNQSNLTTAPRTKNGAEGSLREGGPRSSPEIGGIVPPSNR